MRETQILRGLHKARSKYNFEGGRVPNENELQASLAAPLSGGVTPRKLDPFQQLDPVQAQVPDGMATPFVPGFEARNPQITQRKAEQMGPQPQGLAAASNVSPLPGSSPIPATPLAPDAVRKVGGASNSFGDAASVSRQGLSAGGMNPAGSSWATPGRSTGQPIDQNIEGGRPASPSESIQSPPVKTYQRSSIPNSFVVGTGFKDGYAPGLSTGLARGYTPGDIRRGVAKLEGPGTTTSDSIHGVSLSRGEAVLPAKTVEAVGPENIAALIEETNGKPPTRGLRGGMQAAGGALDPVWGQLTDIELERGAERAATWDGAGKGRNAVPGAQEFAAETRAGMTQPAAEQARHGKLNPSSAAFHGDGTYGANGTTTGQPNATAEAGPRRAPGPQERAKGLWNQTKRYAGNLMGGAQEAAGAAKSLPARGLMGAGRLGLAATPAFGAFEAVTDKPENVRALADSTGMDYDSDGGRIGANVLNFLEKTGNAATFGLAGKLGQGLSNKWNGGSFFDGASTPAQPAAQAQTGEQAQTGMAAGQDDLAAKNAAMQAKFAAENPDLSGQPAGLAKLNDVRNVDALRGTREVFTAANSTDGKPVWQTVSTPEALARMEQDKLADRAERDAAAERAMTGPTSYKAQLASMQEQRANDTLQQVRDAALWNPRAAALYKELMATKATQDSARLTADVSRSNNAATNATSRENSLRDAQTERIKNEAEARRAAATAALAAGKDGRAALKDGREALVDAIKRHRNSFVPKADGSPGSEYSGERAGALEQYVSTVKPTIEGKSLQELYAAGETDKADSVLTRMSNELQMREFANKYSRDALFGKGTDAGVLKVKTPPRNMERLQDALHNNTHISDAIWGGAVLDVGGYGVDEKGRKKSIAIPITEILAQPNGREMLAAALDRYADDNKPKK